MRSLKSRGLGFALGSRSHPTTTCHVHPPAQLAARVLHRSLGAVAGWYPRTLPGGVPADDAAEVPSPPAGFVAVSTVDWLRVPFAGIDPFVFG